MSEQSALLVSLLAALAGGACGGTAVDSRRGPPLVDGGPTVAGVSDPCDSDLAPPTFSVEPACSGFTPTLGSAFSMELVERVVVRDGASQWLEHRFRADADTFQCGFDVVLRLDRLTFAALGDRFDGTVWWIEGSGPLNTLTLVLRSADRLKLAVATAGNATLLVNVSPYEVSLTDDVCRGTPTKKAALLENGVSLNCEIDAGDGIFERCSSDADVFRTVPYFVPRSQEPPTVIADAALLQSAR